MHVAQNKSSWTSDYKLKSAIDELNKLNIGQNKTIHFILFIYFIIIFHW